MLPVRSKMIKKLMTFDYFKKCNFAHQSLSIYIKKVFQARNLHGRNKLVICVAVSFLPSLQRRRLPLQLPLATFVTKPLQHQII